VAAGTELTRFLGIFSKWHLLPRGGAVRVREFGVTRNGKASPT
jgi:hypothetical protein